MTILTALAAGRLAAGIETVQPPPNAPAAVEWNAQAGWLSLRYHGGAILEAALRAEDAAGCAVAGAEIRLESTETLGEKVEQRLKFVLAKPQEGANLALSGTLAGSEEAFPVETDGEAQKRFPLVRNCVGLSHNLRNNAVYDRRWDWVLSGPGDGATRIQPQAAEKARISFTWESRGASLDLVFRPRFYQKHRELANYEPWTYPVWKGPVTGYCTWWAYRDGFSQKTLDAIVDVFAEKHLPDFGYRYIQIDDSYQIGNGSCPQNWLTWNGKFPGGAEYAVRKIRSAGMKPGIWVHRVHRPSDPHVADIGKQHPDWFVHKPNGDLFMDAGFYILNTRNKEALDGMARPVFRELKKQGWDYVKIDGAGDLLSCYKNGQCADHFKAIGSTPEQSLRDWDVVAREELGRDVYILNCWGVWPGRCVIGLVDGCRLGSDGFQWNTLVQNNSWNGVVWRGDPDHCDIMAEGAKDKTTMKTFGTPAAMADTIDQPSVVAMAGGVLMVSDKVEAYRDDSNLEGMKRSAPVLFTVPGQLYDGGADGTWWLQEIDRPFERWSVLARFNWRQEKLKWKRADAPEQEVKFADLGLADDREYLVFEFWTQTFLGRSKGSFRAPAQDSNSAVQVFAIREARPHPWVLSTTRHISQGGVSLLDERWDAEKKVLSGKSAVVAGDPYVLTLHLPQGFQIRGAEVGGEKVEIAGGQETGAVRIVPAATKTVEWKIDFAAAAVTVLPPATAAGVADIRIADFEGTDYGAWKVEGKAFGTAPARGTLPGQMEVTGFQGHGLVNSFLGGDGPIGKLTSPEFTIDRDHIKFLIGGGGYKGKTCMNLLVDDKVVLSATGPNTEPGGSEFLNWENWDVRPYKGKKAAIEIVDDASSGWGHINVDDIRQSDTPAKKNPPPPRRSQATPPLENAREVVMTGRYLLFPVSNKGQRGRMTVQVGDQLVHNLDCDFPSKVDAIDWWGWLDMAEYAGKTARISARAAPEVSALIESGDRIRHLQPLYDEPLRPQFHMSQMRGWNNDPNGMCYYGGQYHFFWQSNPAGPNWANMYWGHATSPDMVHWTEQAHALRPYGGKIADRHRSMADGECFSGSGNVDLYNTAGWQKGVEKTMVLVFTDTGCGESIAYSTDRGRTWQYYEGNPVIRHSGRDPKLVWYAPGKHWVITLFDNRPPYGDNISIYTSKDLKEWEYSSSISGYFECAELFELPVDGDAAKKRWVIFAADARYAIGNFDGKKFTPEHEGKHQVHWGPYYASQCFSGNPDGRVVQIGWARIDMPGMPFNQTFSAPTELTLRTTDDGIRLFAAPIRELEQLRKPNPQTVSSKELTAATPTVEFDVVDQLLDIVVTLRKGAASQAVLRFGENAVTYDFGTQKLEDMPLKMKDGQVTFRVLVDRPMHEVVGGGGSCFKTDVRRDMGKPLGKISLTARGGSLTLESFTAHEMNSAWKK